MPGNLKQEILARYKSVHAFCKAHPELSRGTVYQTVSGRYAGSFINQAKRIRASLYNQPCDAASSENFRMPTREQIEEKLQEIRCYNCRKLNRRECMACRNQTASEASALFDQLYKKD